MSLEDNKRIAHRFHFDIIQDQKLEVADEIVAPDAPIYSASRPFSEALRGPEGAKTMARGDHQAFPDGLFFEHNEAIAEGDMVAVRWTARGAHKGELFSVPPSGKEITFWGVDIYRIVNGKIVEVYVVYARLPILQQLGAKITLPEA